MKTHPHLLVRDALAELFVAAATGEAGARDSVRALARWCGGGRAGPALAGIRAEDGRPLFAGEALHPDFAALEPYVRDRAARLEAACTWIESAGAERDPLERARAAWDAALFFEVHEVLEPVWLEAQGAERELLQGLIMAGAGLHHLEGGNRAGARGLLRDAGRHLESAPHHPRFEWARLGHALQRLAERIDAGTLGTLADLDDVPRWSR